MVRRHNRLTGLRRLAPPGFASFSLPAIDAAARAARRSLRGCSGIPWLCTAAPDLWLRSNTVVGVDVSPSHGHDDTGRMVDTRF